GDLRRFRELLLEGFECLRQIEEQRALLVIAHHALYPEDKSDARPARDAGYVMDRTGWIEQKVACWKSGAIAARRQFRDELSAVVFIRAGNEQGCGDVSAHRRVATKNRGVAMVTVFHAFRVAIHHWRTDDRRHRRREGLRVPTQRLQRNAACRLCLGTLVM